MSIDFKKSGADTGYNNDDSIEPVENAENANQTVFQRPSENLRGRTEDIRRAVDEIDAVVSSDRGLTIMSDPAMTVTWNGITAGGGDGEFTISDDILLIPIVNPADESSDNNIWGRLSYDEGGSEYFSVRSKLRIGDEGGNTLKFEIFKETGVNPLDPIVTVVGSKDGAGNFDPGVGPVLVRVQIADNDSHQWSEVVFEINNHTDLTGNVSDWLEASAHINIAILAPKVITEQLLWEGKGAQVTGIGGCDAQTYAVTPATLAAFFALPKELKEGDALVIDFPSRHNRLARAGDSPITMGELQLIHRDESDPPTSFSESGYVNFMGAVPICKVINDRLYFINGAVLSKAQAGTIMPDASLRSELADDTVGTCGAELVGSDVLSGSPKTIGPGTIFKQLGDILTFGNDHINANFVTMQHPIADVLEFEPLVVDASGNADYTTIQAALSAIVANTGGIIMVNSGTYNESLTFPNMTAPLHVLALGKVVITPVSPNPAFTFAGMGAAGNEGKIIIEGFRMSDTQTSIPNFVEFGGVGFSAGSWAIFRRCALGRNTASVHHIVETDADVNVRFENCTLDGYATEQSAGVETDPFIKVLAGSAPRIEILNSYCKSWARIVYYADHSTGDLGSLLFENNRIYGCGYTDSADGDPSSVLLGCGNMLDTLTSCIVSDNTWYANASSPTEQCGGFILLAGLGSITSNTLQQPFDYTPTGYVNNIIRTTGISVIGNTLFVGLGGGISSSNSEISNNTIKDFQGSTANLSAISLFGGTIANNHITCDTSPAPLCDEIINADGGSVIVSGNVITSAPAKVGILLDNAESVAVGNVISFDAAGTGIVVEGERCTVSGNMITNASVGIDVQNSYNTITGNTLNVTGTGSSGILVGVTGTATHCSINGNTCSGVSGQGKGIYSANDNNTICGNQILFFNEGIRIIADSNTVTGNGINNSFVDGIYINGNYNCICGNAIDTVGGSAINEAGGSNNGVQYEGGGALYSLLYNNPGP